MSVSGPTTYYWTCGRCKVLSTSESGLTTPWPRSDAGTESSNGSCSRPECQLLQISHPLDHAAGIQHQLLITLIGGRLYRCDDHGRLLADLGLRTDAAGMPLDQDGRAVEAFGYDTFGRLVNDRGGSTAGANTVPTIAEAVPVTPATTLCREEL